MRWTVRALLFACVVVGALSGPVRAEDDAWGDWWDDCEQDDGSLRMPLRAPEADLRAALAERAFFDGVTLRVETDEQGRPWQVVRREGVRLVTGLDTFLTVSHLDGRLAERARLRGLSDGELAAELDASYPVTGLEWKHVRCELLSEILRRGGPAWAARVHRALQAVVEQRAASSRIQERGLELELLTVSRRLAGEPDPFRLDVETAGTCVHPELPPLGVRIVNRSDRSVPLKRGGNYRCGRERRYHVEVRDAGGRLQPLRSWDTSDGGGMFQRVPIAPGEELTTTLPMASYVAPLPPGEYSVRVHYSDHMCIDEPDVPEGEITVVSPVFTLRVERRVIESTAAWQARLAALADALPASGPVMVLRGEPGRWMDRLLKPGSPAAELRRAGWEAVPVLAALAAREHVPALRRAWALATLHGITGLFDPTSLRLLGPHEVHGGGRRVVTGGGLTASSSTTPAIEGIDIDEERQLRLARAWLEFLATCDVRVRPQ